MKVPPRTHPRRSPHVAAEQLDGEGILFHERTMRVCILNSTGNLVWSLIDGASSVEELVLEIADVIGNPLLVRRDVNEILAALVDAGFAEWHHAAHDAVANPR